MDALGTVEETVEPLQGVAKGVGRVQERISQVTNPADTDHNPNGR
jgi:hypothetical protein